MKRFEANFYMETGAFKGFQQRGALLPSVLQVKNTCNGCEKHLQRLWKRLQRLWKRLQWL